MANYSFTSKYIKEHGSLPEVENNAVIENCNLSQKEPHTSIYEGKTGLTFRNCLLINCNVPEGSVLEGCNNIHKDFCANIHLNWGLDAELEDCSHVIDTDSVIIDGELVGTIYHYEDKVVE